MEEATSPSRLKQKCQIFLEGVGWKAEGEMLETGPHPKVPPASPIFQIQGGPSPHEDPVPQGGGFSLASPALQRGPALPPTGSSANQRPGMVGRGH